MGVQHTRTASHRDDMMRPKALLPRLTCAALSLALCGGLGVVSGCSAIGHEARRDFEQASLNGVYYGAYHRPVARDVRRVFGAEARLARADQRQRRGDARRDDDEVARSTPAAQPQRQDDAGSETRRDERREDTPAARPSPPTQPAPSAPIPTAEAGGFDPANAVRYVQDVYAVNETPLPGASVADLWRHATQAGTVYHHPRPVVGDLVFFSNTHDADGDRRPNDFFTHVGLVESVDGEATITVLSYLGGRVRRFTMNVEQPSVERVSGEEINTAIREERRDDLPSTAYLAGELFNGFASLLGSRSEVIVLDNWSPSTRLEGLASR